MERDQRARHTTHASAATVVVVLLAAGAAVGQSPGQGQARDQALQEFDQRLVAYLNLRRAISEKMTPLAATANGRELAARQKELTGALQSARATAKPGDLIPSSIATRIQMVIGEDLKRRSVDDERATLGEVPDAPIPIVNRPYPLNAALPTLPPLLLLRLPRLPENLQYRFYGRHLVVLDGDTQIIVDYIANVLPRR